MNKPVITWPPPTIDTGELEELDTRLYEPEVMYPDQYAQKPGSAEEWLSRALDALEGSKEQLAEIADRLNPAGKSEKQEEVLRGISELLVELADRTTANGVNAEEASVTMNGYLGALVNRADQVAGVHILADVLPAHDEKTVNAKLLKYGLPTIVEEAVEYLQGDVRLPGTELQKYTTPLATIKVNSERDRVYVSLHPDCESDPRLRSLAFEYVQKAMIEHGGIILDNTFSRLMKTHKAEGPVFIKPTDKVDRTIEEYNEALRRERFASWLSLRVAVAMVSLTSWQLGLLPRIVGNGFQDTEWGKRWLENIDVPMLPGDNVTGYLSSLGAACMGAWYTHRVFDRMHAEAAVYVSADELALTQDKNPVPHKSYEQSVKAVPMAVEDRRTSFIPFARPLARWIFAGLPPERLQPGSIKYAHAKVTTSPSIAIFTVPPHVAVPTTDVLLPMPNGIKTADLPLKKIGDTCKVVLTFNDKDPTVRTITPEGLAIINRKRLEHKKQRYQFPNELKKL